MNHGIEGAEGIVLFRRIACLTDVSQIADDRRMRSGDRGQRVPSSLVVASVQNYAVLLLNEDLCGHAAEPVERADDEYARHCLLPPGPPKSVVVRTDLDAGSSRTRLTGVGVQEI